MLKEIEIKITKEGIMIAIGNRVKELRQHLGMNQERLAELLGVKRQAVSSMEKGERKICVDELIKLAEIFNLSVESLLDLEKAPEVILEESTKREKIKSQIRINVPQKNLEKFKEVFLYILNKVGSRPNIGQTVLYKLFYFIDFDYYEKYEEQLIGATYMKNKYGPTPVEFQKIAERLIADEEIVQVESEYYKYPQTKYLPLRKADLSKLKANETEVIDDVLNRLSDMTANQITEYSHKDVPWVTTEQGKPIEYESVFYRAPPYSVREYSEEI